jgi:hypothetical protein
MANLHAFVQPPRNVVEPKPVKGEHAAPVEMLTALHSTLQFLARACTSPSWESSFVCSSVWGAGSSTAGPHPTPRKLKKPQHINSKACRFIATPIRLKAYLLERPR